MKQTAVIKSLRIVQTPLMDCLHAVMPVANLSFGVYIPIAEQMEVLGKWRDLSSAELTSSEARDNADSAEESEEADPPLDLLHMPTSNVTEIDERVEKARHLLHAEMRVVKGTHSDNPDPLLALAGTLECDVTDIGERHDDYIAAALLAELRGDDDE